ncbi:hypothetical protein FLA105534_03468 [Flavobacterium bizetiae]|uniref:Uncharacterized protein n=1 Tax=Flavobacterium bizetiae TaxID=2704140 RepID=A0A6J4GQD9_9FLAO|nr:hypothetical protein [Flavobacterium bizetiae]CAA9201216.1 hypothetical protein FLA105534_03468 [Flavobacterium bizetiae]CAD5340481.1 hypothetical protein FLA105535_00435 [Flavobacterium bizetiae]CAD5346884.1 hypothetical protein FLA105534_00827 [Flavobacterium bizetiae]
MSIKKYVFGSFKQSKIEVTDPDAQYFIDVAPIINYVQANAINTLVTSLKEKNIWDKMQAIYPFVGGTANTHKFNLKSPIDADSSFRITYFGIQEHNNKGMEFISGSYALTQFNFNRDSVINDFHWSSYIRTATPCYLFQGGRCQLFNTIGVNGKMAAVSDLYDDSGSLNSRVMKENLDGKGYYLASKTLINGRHSIYKNGNLLNINYGTQGILNNNNVSIGSYLYGSDMSIISFATIGKGLTDNESLNLYKIIEEFQTSLGRQV